VLLPLLRTNPAQSADAFEREWRTTLLAADRLHKQVRVNFGADGSLFVEQPVTEPAFWAKVRQELIARPDHVARMVGIPEVANLRQLPMPTEAIKLADLIDVYRKQNPSTDKSKREAIATLNRLIEETGAKLLDDLTQDKLLSFRQSIEGSGTLKSAATRKAYYGRIKTIISFGLKVGLDQRQITAALARCAVLWTAEPMPAPDPRPISPEVFNQLLKFAGAGPWRAWLLLGLNLCMYMEELCGLRWEEFDLAKRTYASIRTKTRRHRIPRAAVLWKETVAELNKLRRRGPYVFTSSHGTRFNRNTKINDFRDFCDAAGMSKQITFSCIRDGAYTSACRARVDDKWARVLAGHKAAGLQDNYVLRHPEIAAPACAAVYKDYAPFPAVGKARTIQRKPAGARGR
jgi:integrase